MEIGYQRALFIAMLLENEAKEDKQKVDGKYQGRLQPTEYTMPWPAAKLELHGDS